RQGEKLRRLEEVLRRRPAPRTTAPAAAMRKSEPDVQARRIGAGLPGAIEPGSARNARPAGREAATEVRPQARDAAGSPPPRRAGGRPRERTGQRIEMADGDLR